MVRQRNCWLPLLLMTLIINLVSAVMFPNLVTDAFTAEIFVVSVVPVLWGFFLLFRYRSRGERFVAWFAVLGAFFWLLPTIGMPIEFLGR